MRISNPQKSYFSYVASYGVMLTWSPDGRWVIAGAMLPAQLSQMDVIEVATGLTLPLKYTHVHQWSGNAPYWLE